MWHSIMDGNIGTMAVVGHKIVKAGAETEKLLEPFGKGHRFYEVIRCIEGVPLFLEDHIGRLRISAGDLLDEKKLKSDIAILIREEKIYNGNIKVVLTEDVSVVFKNTYYYPDEKMYAEGVNVGVLQFTRNDPNMKILNDEYKRAVSRKLEEEGPYGKYFETLLVSDEGKISEGSRSNAFFLSEKKVVTAPDDAILKGVTRKYIIEAIESSGLQLSYELTDISLIGTEYNSAFISGTSIGVLPLAAVEDIRLSSASDKALQQIRKEYEEKMHEYIKANK